MAFPQAGILDNFNRANENPLTSANWGTPALYVGLRILSNVCAYSDTENNNASYWLTSFGVNQEAYFTLPTLPANFGTVQAFIRANSSFTQGYVLQVRRDDAGNDTVEVYPQGGVGSTSATITLTAGDSFGIRAVGSTITGWHKPVAGSWTQVVSLTDSTYSGSGFVGLWFDDLVARVDDFGGGLAPLEGALAKTLGALTSSGSTGTVKVTGTSAKTLGTLTVTSAAVAAIAGSVTKTLGALTSSGSTGTVKVTGTSAKTLGTLTVTSAAVAAIAGSVTKTLGALTVTSAGTLPIVGSSAKTLGALTSTGAGAVALAGSLAKTLGDLTTISAGGVGALGSLDKTLASLTLSSAATVAIAGALAKTLGNLTLSSAGIVIEYRTYIISDTFALDDSGDLGNPIIAPIFVSTDTLTLTEVIAAPLIVQADTLTLTDTPVITVAPIVITDTLDFFETYTVEGAPVTPPATAATGGLDNNPVLRLLYGNDRRHLTRSLDLAQSAPGHIFLKSGGFAPGAGELNELWSGESVRFDGQQKLAESRKNSTLSITYDLSSGSMAGLSALQRQINQFFLEAKLRQVRKQGEKVWLEYRWSDNLSTLPTPTFGQLSGYYEVLAAKSPKWPDNLHTGALVAGEIEEVTCELTCSPAPEGLKQRAALAGGTISLHDKGVLIASGASSKLHWAGYTNSGLTGNFTITGWITLNATWSSGTKDIFDYYVNASNRIRIQYDRGNTRWVITKIVGGTTYTANSSSDAVANGDDIHLILVQDATTLYLYVNGALAASVTANNNMTDAGLIALGCPGTGTIDGIDVILDGWRVLPEEITSTQALALYTAELPIKQNGSQVGPPPYWWTKDGDGQVDNCDDSGRDHWGIIAGVSGDLEAEIEIRIGPATDYGNSYYWLGIKHQDAQYTPSDYIWFETNQGDQVVDNAASAGSYFNITSSSSAQDDSTDTIDPSLLLDKYHWLARIKTSGPALVTPGWSFSSSIPVKSKVVSVANSSFEVVSLGDIFVMTDAELSSDAFGIKLAFTGAAITLGADFSFLLPAPFAKIAKPAGAVGVYSGTPLIIENRRAYVHNGSKLLDHYGYKGDELVVAPNKYNYLFLLQLNSNNDFVRTHVADITIYVTPRYLLPGGMVA